MLTYHVCTCIVYIHIYMYIYIRNIYMHIHISHLNQPDPSHTNLTHPPEKTKGTEGTA